MACAVWQPGQWQQLGRFGNPGTGYIGFIRAWVGSTSGQSATPSRLIRATGESCEALDQIQRGELRDSPSEVVRRAEQLSASLLRREPTENGVKEMTARRREPRF